MNEDALRTRLCEEYGCEYPIVAFCHTKEVVAAVTNAGGIGVLGTTQLLKDEFRRDVRWICDQVGDKPFGIDTLLPATFQEGNVEDLEAMIPQEHRDFVERLQLDNEIPDPSTPPPWQPSVGADLLQRARDHIDVTLEERVPIFASGLGNPAVILDRAHAAGTKVWGLIGMTRQARREFEAGVDLVIAQGGDSGAHSGRIGTFSLVPAVTRMAREYDTPVLAAGGVTRGEHLVAALALGAVGVWCGTIWQATTESHIDPYLKEKLVKAATEDSTKSRALTGKPAARLRSRMIDAWEQPDAPEPLGMPLQPMLMAKLMQAVDDHHVEEFMNVRRRPGRGPDRRDSPDQPGDRRHGRRGARDPRRRAAAGLSLAARYSGGRRGQPAARS